MKPPTLAQRCRTTGAGAPAAVLLASAILWSAHVAGPVHARGAAQSQRPDRAPGAPGAAPGPADAPAAPLRPPLPTTARPLAPVRRLADDLRAFTAADGVRRGLWGIVVYSLDRRQRLFDMNPQALFVPASTAKLVSAAAAYDAVGWSYRFETSLWATGPIEDGVLHGDLVVSGSGDPSIASRGWSPLVEWAEALRELGITKVEGRIVGDDDAVEEPRPALAWSWDDLGYPTGALFGALNAEENRLIVTVTPGVEHQPAVLVTEPRAAHRPLVNRTMTTGPGAPPLLWPEQRPAEPGLTVAGTIRSGARPARLAVSAGNPTLWFAGLLRHALVEQGISVTGEAVDGDTALPRARMDGAVRLMVHRSPTLGELVRPLLKESINLYGEAFLRLNAARDAFPTNDAALEGLERRMAVWGAAADGQQIVDGSGLSRRNAVSPETLLTVLQRMFDPSGRSPFMQALPLAAVDGSLASRMRGTLAARNVRAKTGTMSNVRTLAGYVTTLDGEQLAMVVMVNNFEGAGARAVAAIDAIAARLAGFTRKGP